MFIIKPTAAFSIQNTQFMYLNLFEILAVNYHVFWKMTKITVLARVFTININLYYYNDVMYIMYTIA